MKLTPKTGLDLRKKTLPCLGWRLFFVGDGALYREVVPPSDPPFEMEPDQERLWEEVSFDRISDADLLKCPAVESDPGVSEPLFLAWIVSEETNFHLCDWFENVMQTKRRFEIEMHFKDGRHAFAFGSSPSEARARAIVECALFHKVRQ